MQIFLKFLDIFMDIYVILKSFLQLSNKLTIGATSNFISNTNTKERNLYFCVSQRYILVFIDT